MIEVYLKGCKQYVEAGNNASKLAETKYRIPQGSILGPVDFSFYIIDLEVKPQKEKLFCR